MMPEVNLTPPRARATVPNTWLPKVCFRHELAGLGEPHELKPLKAETDGIRDGIFAKACSREFRNRRRSENGAKL